MKTSINDFTFTETVSAVDDLGMDPTGRRDATQALRDARRTGRAVDLGDGTYSVSGRINYGSVSRFGLRGDGATLRVRNHRGNLINFRGGSDIYLGGFNIDYGPVSERTSGTIHIFIDDGLLVEDMNVLGAFATTPGDNDPRWLITPQITSSGGTGLIRNLQAHDGSVWLRDKFDMAGFSWLGPNHTGTVRFVDCGWSNWIHGIYGSRTNGPVQVQGGYYKNNYNGVTRVSHPRSWIDGAHIVIDERELPSYCRPGREITYDSFRGVRFESGPRQHYGAEARNCLFEMRNSTKLTAAAEITQGGRYTVRDCQFIMDVNAPAIRGRSPWRGPAQYHGNPSPHNLTIEGCVVVGSASGGWAMDFESRAGTTVEDVCIHQPNGSRGGVRFHAHGSRAHRGTVANSTINVGGTAVTGGGSSNISRSGSCEITLDPDDPDTDTDGPADTRLPRQRGFPRHRGKALLEMLEQLLR